MIKRPLFGTDGVRGKANDPPMTPDILMRLASAAGYHCKNGDHRHTVVIGKDTRLSGYMLEPALTAGFVAVGMNVVLVGPLPTPGISMLVPSLRADLGVVISASHNLYQDNGIKLFGPDGYKLSKDKEQAIERTVFSEKLDFLVASQDLGRAHRLEDASGRYIEFIKNTFPKQLSLDGLKIVLDCAHGAAYKVAPTVFWELGADIISIGDKPNGLNINENRGATAPQAMCQAVRDQGADLGIALDGDGDRLVMADEKGRLIDGDQLLGLIALSWQNRGLIKGNRVVGTVMSNLGLEKFLATLGLDFTRTPVGDRHISDYMRAHQCNIGGEQSGHIILSDYARTGDGLVAALQILAVLVESQRPVSQIAHVFEPIPQVLKNLPLNPGASPLEDPQVQQAIYTAQEQLGSQGRLVIRPSGTEPLLRLMAEGENLSLISLLLESVITSMKQQGYAGDPQEVSHAS